MDGDRISRRSVLLGGLAVVAAGSVPSAIRTLVGAPGGTDPLARRLRALVDSAGVRELGQARLTELPAGVTEAEVARQVLPSHLDAAMALEVSDEQLHDAIVTGIEEDLRGGAVLPVLGWLLSETEAGLCVLTVLRR
jgi:hypothetical protein